MSELFKDDRIGPGIPEFKKMLEEPELKNITVLVSEWLDLHIKLMAIMQSEDLLRSRLSIAMDALRAIEEDSKTGTVSAQTFHEALNYLRSINTIANAAFNEGE